MTILSGARQLFRARPTATPQFFIICVTISSLLSSFIISAFWFSDTTGTGRFEPAVESLGLLAGIAGVVLERRAAARERRDQSLDAVRNELLDNQIILNSSAFVDQVGSAPIRRIFPTLHLSAVDSILSAAGLSSPRDAELARLLHRWRDEVTVFNHQLLLAEILAFTADSQEVLQDLHSGLHSPDGQLAEIRARIDALLARLA
ncbi:MAG: hypothetical protein ACQSGP_29440 [Frankia sp.]